MGAYSSARRSIAGHKGAVVSLAYRRAVVAEGRAFTIAWRERTRAYFDELEASGCYQQEARG